MSEAVGTTVRLRLLLMVSGPADAPRTVIVRTHRSKGGRRTDPSG
ncbi:hypothetical protein [Tenggerimyces flavus]|uniref:Uncharacterized protein n=1 Tax=Tenggerimyces flavus TaxID=1708749 RepID=A0ABV7YMN8_9ACTN|nr:hypothetical protein [Tenggerimyces flavus]MBM7787741.1 hypothetical protein [Tenggerimyces flavus]